MISNGLRKSFKHSSKDHYNYQSQTNKTAQSTNSYYRKVQLWTYVMNMYCRFSNKYKRTQTLKRITELYSL